MMKKKALFVLCLSLLQVVSSQAFTINIEPISAKQATRIVSEKSAIAKQSDSNIVWIDLETTGIDEHENVMLEIAVLITDKNFNIIAYGPDLVIHQSEAVLQAMGQWCTETHTNSGLYEKVLKSAVSVKEAERQVLDFVKQYCKKGKCYLAGNTVSFDRRYLKRYMPELEEYLKYQNLDVTSIRIVVKNLFPEKKLHYKKKNNHRALDDIEESVGELQYYVKEVFKER